MKMDITAREIAGKQLEDIVEALDLDGVLYVLCQIGVKRANEAQNPAPHAGIPVKVNNAEVEFWRKAVEILSDAQTKIEEIKP